MYVCYGFYGSIFGVLLYIIYINDMALKALKCEIALYGDDTLILTDDKTDNKTDNLCH